jgi:hypothetical protein
MELDENRKEVLYYRAIRNWSPQKLAAFRGQIDRNIRKLYDKTLEYIRDELYAQLRSRFERGAPLTIEQQRFCEEYITEQPKGKRAKTNEYYLPKTNSYWAKYDLYEYRRGTDGELYLMPAPNAKPSVYDSMQNPEPIVIDALNVGRLAMKRGDERKMMDAVLGFVNKYGLLGFLPALPTTADFIDYDAVYFSKNHFIREETMQTKDYLELFFPFDKPNLYKNTKEARFDVGTGEYRNEVVALQ